MIRTSYLVLFIVLISIGVGAASAQSSDGTVKSFTKISDTQGNFTGILEDGDLLGVSITGINDLNGDGVTDVAIGIGEDDDGGNDRGAVYVLFMNNNGTIKSHQKISNFQGNFTGILDDDDFFGSRVSGLGDLNGDGVNDLSVLASNDGDGGSFKGAIWNLFLNTNGTVKSHQKISATEGNFTGIFDRFEGSLRNIGDLDGDGVTDLAVGSRLDDDGGLERGAVWILFLNTNGTVKSQQKISDIAGNFTGILDNEDWFGYDVDSLGDLNNDGVRDIAVASVHDDDGCVVHCENGAVWILFLNQNGTVKSHQKISNNQGNFTGIFKDVTEFGSALASLGDIDNDSIVDLAVGANGYADEITPAITGAVWILFLNSDGTVKSHQKISNDDGNFEGVLGSTNSAFGKAVVNLGDLDQDGIPDLGVGARADNDGGNNRGALWILFLGNDEDDDGVTDTQDNCPVNSNSNQADTDGDGEGDVCNDANDSDGDEYSNSLDNCPVEFNSIQSDSDGDGNGNVCDICPRDFNNDSDGDNICVGSTFNPPATGDNDNCPVNSNPNQADYDNDGIGDVCDLTPYPACESLPISSDWNITSNCTLENNFISPANVLVQNNSVLIIQNGITLDIDFTNFSLIIKSGSTVLVQLGGTIT